ncbi:MAG: hypothetical protein ACLFP2_05070 [Candidatus Woesearchaeota archaeon]
MAENVRIPKKTMEKMHELRYTTEPFTALNGYVDLIENYWMTEQKKLVTGNHMSLSGKCSRMRDFYLTMNCRQELIMEN